MSKIERKPPVEPSGIPALPDFQRQEAKLEQQAELTRGERFRQTLRQAADWKSLAKTPYGVGPVLVIGLIGLFRDFDATAFILAGPDIVQDLGVRIESVVYIGAVVSFFGLFGAIGVGWWVDRHRRVPLYAIGTMLSGVFSMVRSRATNLVTLGVPRAADSLSNIASGVAEFPLLADYYPPESRGRVFAAQGVMRNLSDLLAPVAVGALIVAIGWRGTTLMIASPLVILGIVAMLYLKEPVRGYMERRSMGASEEVARREEDPPSFAEAWRIMWSVRTLRRVFLGLIWTLGGSAISTSFFPFFLADHYGLDAFDRALLVTPGAIAALGAAYLGGGMIDVLIRRNPGRVLVITALVNIVQAGLFVAIATAPPVWVLVVAFVVFQSILAFAAPATNVAIAQVIPPSIRGQGLQVIFLARIPSLFIFIPIAGAIFTQYGFQATFFTGLPIFLIGAGLYASAAGLFGLDMRSAFAQSLASEEWRKAREGGTGKLLVCRGVDVEYDGVQVLFDVDFDVTEGEIIALLGTNGAGKSTLLKAISGTQEASSGAVVFDGRDITHMPPHEVAARGVVHMPGGRGIFPTLTVRENLMMARWLIEEEAEAKSRLAEVFEIFPVLRERAPEPAGALSGGEQQMLSLAQAFLMKPRLLMIDELSMGLSPAVVGQLLEIVREINRRGITIIVVEQSVSVALNIAERAIFMEKGEVQFVGKTVDLLSRPDILRAVYVKGTGGLAEDLPRVRAAESRVGQTVLEVRDIEKSFGGVKAVAGVSFDLREGQVLGFIGPNGAGKTTIFDLISGYQPLDAGVVKYEGVDIAGTPPEELARRKMIRRFQDARLFPSLTVEEALLVALEQRLEVKNTLLILGQFPGPRRAERRIRLQAARLIELLGLEAYSGKFVRELSTGVRRILDLGCVLAAQPKVLLLDEPSTGIAQAEAVGLAPLLLRVRSETGCSILIIEHTMSLISAVSDELLALDQGRVLMQGSPEEVLNDERVIESYLGGTEASINR